jgi:hypothetical protein
MAINFDVTLNGVGLNDYGLFGASVDGLGLNTYGFIWLCSSIWDNADEDITTLWSACSGPPSTNLEACDE